MQGDKYEAYTKYQKRLDINGLWIPTGLHKALNYF